MPVREAITLRAMRFHARVGVLPHEREHPQPIEIDVTAWRTRSGPTNRATILDYRDVYAVAARAVAHEPELLEQIGDLVSAELLHAHGVERVRVAVRKPQVMLQGPLAYAEVVIERKRG